MKRGGEMQKSFSKVFLVFLPGLMLVILACNLPGSGADKVGGITQTARVLEQSIQLTQAALVGAEIPGMVKTPSPVSLETSLPELSQTQAVEPSPTLTIEMIHTRTPGQPPAAKGEIVDFNSKPYAESKYTVGGDSYKAIFLERPFDSSMNYRADIDILKTELTADGEYDFITIFLAGKGSASQSLKAFYAVELDTDYDGRGDYLIWAGSPVGADWSASNVAVYRDTNNDVGGSRALFSDAPFTGDGYDTKIYPSEGGGDPDLAFCRLAPNQSSAVQIAFKPQLLDKSNAFMWGVTADDGLKSPGKYDYNDIFTEAEAGSPLKDNPNYPLKGLFNVDNTCRMSYGRLYSSTDPGACGFATPTLPPVTVPTLKIPVITLVVPGLY